MADNPTNKPAHAVIIDKLNELVALADNEARVAGKGGGNTHRIIVAVTVYHQLDVLKQMRVPDQATVELAKQLAEILNHSGFKVLAGYEFNPGSYGVEGPIGPAIESLLREIGDRMSERASCFIV